MRIVIVLAAALALAFAGCGEAKAPEDKPEKEEAASEKAEEKAEEPAQEADPMTELLAKFAPTEIGVADGKIPEKHRGVVKKLVEAAKILDELFLLQVDGRNKTWREKIAKDPKLETTLAVFDVMYGPWNRLDHNKPFWGNVEKPKGANYYPQDIKQEELEKWIVDHPDQKEAFTGYFTLIARDGDGLKTVPYSEAYKEHLEPAAVLLEAAAELAEDARLKKYLASRAAAFKSNDYRRSDMDWMDLGDGDIEVVIGPYEVYEDELNGYKAAFEAFITLRDPADSAELEKIKSYIPDMEAYLPIPDEHKNLERGSESPISVVDVLFTAGDTRAGVQTLAFNLPNDEVVREKKGSKKVMLKNVAHAKYEQILVPIAKRLIHDDQVKNVSFKAFFNHTLVHETAHGLGPGKIKIEKDGKLVETSVNAELKELYPVIEEAKADILGMFLNYMLIDKGMHPAEFVENVYASFLGGFFRSVRFGANEAHGKANVIQFNYLAEKGAVVRGEDGKYACVADKMPDAVKSLAHDLLMIEALGDYGAAKAFVEKYGEMPKEMQEALDGLADIPTDIRPSYPIEKQMAAW
ncbi:MAG: peptidase [Deltaproteobacteria bacterium]|nr:peptidase [Deltaproteobacteria bacterium]